MTARDRYGNADALSFSGKYPHASKDINEMFDEIDQLRARTAQEAVVIDTAEEMVRCPNPRCDGGTYDDDDDEPLSGWQGAAPQTCVTCDGEGVVPAAPQIIGTQNQDVVNYWKARAMSSAEAAVIDAAKAWNLMRTDWPAESLLAVTRALTAAVDALVSQEQAEP